MLTVNDIRQKFLEYFKKHNHQEIPSSSLIPRDDPSLLFTNAGMVQFKKVFTGQETRNYLRATTAQKCLRVGGKHNDLENVGRTARHHTFFEMLGNFSFGDYFKKEAIQFAWVFITEELNLSKEFLYITIYKDDNDAYDIWVNTIGVEPNRIYRMGEKDNFWSMGDTGPCGPCSEIYFDQGETFCCGDNCGIGTCDCDRFLEIWNLVFMQYEQLPSGERVILPKPSIDTGMGLERIVAICQQKSSNYDTDLFQPIIQYMASIAGVHYKKHEETDTALRVIADHSRAIAFMIADGILPSNEGRGYVLRRLIRRAFRFGKQIGMNQPFLYKTVNKVVEIMGDIYTELYSRSEFMSRVVFDEEERFSITLDKGLILLEAELNALKEKNTKELPGDIAFKLYDTYGFPLDIINDIASKQHVTVDEANFQHLMQEQKERARSQWKGSGEKRIEACFQTLLEDGIQSEFIGYENLSGTGRIVALLDIDGLPIEELPTKSSGYVITDMTPFYGTSGGQTGDIGLLSTITGKTQVVDTLKPATNLIVHVVTVTSGTILLDQEALLVVSESERLDTARNHTCTHILQSVLQTILGDHVRQAGSLVSPTRLRFDFTHIAPLTEEEIHAIELQVNTIIMANLPLTVEFMDQQSALEKGAMALFEEKYGNIVRVVTIGSENQTASIELCSGTHLTSTGQAGCFIIVSETGIAAGVRRIEAITGRNTLTYIKEYQKQLSTTAAILKTKPEKVVEKVTSILSENKNLQKTVDTLESSSLSNQGKHLLDNLTRINNIDVLIANLKNFSLKALRDIMDDIRSKLPSGIVCLASTEGTKVHLLLYVSKDLHHKFTASELIKKIVVPIHGAGGGRPDQAQAGGTNPSGLSETFELLKNILKDQ